MLPRPLAGFLARLARGPELAGTVQECWLSHALNADRGCGLQFLGMESYQLRLIHSQFRVQRSPHNTEHLKSTCPVTALIRRWENKEVTLWPTTRHPYSIESPYTGLGGLDSHQNAAIEQACTDYYHLLLYSNWLRWIRPVCILALQSDFTGLFIS